MINMKSLNVMGLHTFFNELINELKAAIDELSTTLNDSMVGKIRIQMGLQSNAWKNLPKLICDDIKD